MTIVMRPSCWHQNFGPNGLSAPAQGLFSNDDPELTLTIFMTGSDLFLMLLYGWQLIEHWVLLYFQVCSYSAYPQHSGEPYRTNGLLVITCWLVWTRTNLICQKLCCKRDKLSGLTKPRKWHVHPAKTQIILDSDQTGWMPRLIWVFAGRTCHFVGFVMRRLKLRLIRMKLISMYQNAQHMLLTQFWRWATPWENLSLGFCNQVLFKPAFSATEASCSLTLLDIASVGIVLSKQRTTKMLIRLRWCEGWSASLLFAYDKQIFHMKCLLKSFCMTAY